MSGVVELFDDVIADPGRDGANLDGPFAGLPFLMKDLGPTMKGRLQEMGRDGRGAAKSVRLCRIISQVGIRILESRRAALERAAAMHGQSIAGFVEWLVGRALADAGLIERPNPEGP